MSTPKSFVRNGDVVTFRYYSAFLKEWLSLGNRDGNTGPILVRIDYANNMKTFANYGTIENPCRTRYRMHMKHWEVMDGALKEPEEYIKPYEFPFKDAGWIIPGGKEGDLIQLKWK